MSVHIVEQGECIASIAQGSGHTWQRIWDDPANAELKDLRKDPSVLLPGDKVVIPATTPRVESGATETKHVFQAARNQARLSIRFLQEGRPRANQPCGVSIDDDPVLERELDGDGVLDLPIPPDAKTARISVGPPEERDDYEIQLGGLDPATETSGALQRLANLGYGAPAGPAPAEAARAAICRFQRDHGLDPTGEVDERTRKALVDAHGS